MTRIKVYISLSLFLSGILLMHSCVKSEDLDIDLDTIIAIEAFNSRNLSIAGITENEFYPCVNLGQCQPRIVERAVLSISGESATEFDLRRVENQPQAFFRNTATSFKGGEKVTLSVRTPGRQFEATAVFPDSVFTVLNFEYRLGSDPQGLLLNIDRNVFDTLAGLHIRVGIRFVDSSIFIPNYGFIVSQRSFPFSECLNNGQFLSSDVYFIPDSEIQKILRPSGFSLIPGAEIVLVIRNSTIESLEFFNEFNKSLCIPTISVNDGTLFAPPENLPTNFNNGAIGFFHVYTQHRFFDIVR